MLRREVHFSGDEIESDDLVHSDGESLSARTILRAATPNGLQTRVEQRNESVD